MVPRSAGASSNRVGPEPRIASTDTAVSVCILFSSGTLCPTRSEYRRSIVRSTENPKIPSAMFERISSATSHFSCRSEEEV